MFQRIQPAQCMFTGVAAHPFDGCSPAQKAGRSSLPNTAHSSSFFNWTQRTPAGMPGRGEVMEGAMQQAPQSGRQSIFFVFDYHMQALVR